MRTANLNSRWKRFRHNKTAVVGAFILTIVVLSAVFAPIIVPYGPNEMSADFGAPPGGAHLMGTDLIGRDVFSRIIHASRISLIVGLGVTACSVVLGLVMGVVSGFFGGPVDAIIMRLTDIFMSFPILLFILVINSLLGTGMWKLVLVMGVLGWPRYARLIRSEILSLREMDYVKSAVTLGFGTPRILFAHLMPNILGLIIVQATFGIAYAIIMESTLSYLGCGINPPQATWGNMLKNAESLTTLTSLPWLWIPPGLMIVITVLSVNFVGEGLGYAWDPKR
jgi:peptide/nickel transport system permease protein